MGLVCFYIVCSVPCNNRQMTDNRTLDEPWQPSVMHVLVLSVQAAVELIVIMVYCTIRGSRCDSFRKDTDRLSTPR